jgi:type VI secretion system protein ImpG
LQSNDEAGCFTTRREVRQSASRRTKQRIKSSYAGSDLFLRISDAKHGPLNSDVRQVGIETLCTNNDLPLFLRLGETAGDFTTDGDFPLSRVTCISGPSPPRGTFPSGASQWKLISHLSLNYLSLTDSENGGADALRQLLRLYDPISDPATQRQIDGLRSVRVKPAVSRIDDNGRHAIVRGQEIEVSCDETAFEGSGLFTLSMVLDRFLARHAAINSFTRTTFIGMQSGRPIAWPVRLGMRQLA